MTEWQNYPALSGGAANGDTLLMLDISDTPPSAGNVVQVAASKLLNVLYPSNDSSGATDAAAISAAITALGSSPGVVRLMPTGPWYVTGGSCKFTHSGQYLDAPGCVINVTGTGAGFEFVDTSTPSGRAVHGGGITGYPVIDGTATTGNAYAFHGGDIYQLALFFQAQNFTAGTTSKGAWIDNRNFWTEQYYGLILALNCTAGVVFDVSAGNTTNTGSMERGNLIVRINQVGPTFDGVVFQNGAFLQDGTLGIYGNFGTSASALTSAVLRIDGSTPGGVAQASVSNITNSVLNIGAECTSGANAPFTIIFGAGGNFIGACTGNIDFSAASPFQSSNNGGQFVGFIGVTAGDPNLPAALPAGSTNLADTNQTISSTTPTAVTNVNANVAAFTGYDIRIYIPHLGAGTTGTFTFALGGPAIALASLDVKLWTGTTLTTHNLNVSSGTLLAVAPSASQRSLEITGTIAFSAAGTLTVTGAKTSGGSNVTVDIGASMVLTLIATP